MKNFFSVRDHASKGAALMIVLAFVVLLAGVALAYFSRTTTDRQLARSSYNDTAADLLARSALEIVVNDFKQEILSNPTVTTSNIKPTAYGTPTAGQSAIPNLIRRSFFGDPTGRTSTVSSTSPSANGRSVNTARWNSHYLIPRAVTTNSIDTTPVSSFVAPNWTLVTAQGPNSAPLPSAVLGRYAFAVYDEGGVLDMNLAGFPTWTGGGGNPNVSPTPWATNIGRKGILTFADLTALASPSPSSTPSQTLINNIVGWRNFATTQQPGTSPFPNNFDFGGNLNRQNAYGSYVLDFGDPPYTDPSNFQFATVDISTFGAPVRMDQAFMNRQQLLKLLRSVDTSGSWQNRVQYMGTFSRERNRPAPDWPRLSGHLPDRFDISNLGLVKPYPDGAVVCRGQGHNKGNGQGCYKGRGRYRGTAAQIRNLFGLAWVRPDLSVTDSRDLRYWGHWLYVGIPGMPTNCDPGQGCNHIPALRGGSTDFFQILDYALTQANGDDDDDFNIADILSLGASLIDQYDDPNDDLDTDPSTPAGRKTHVTIIGYGGGRFVLGWESGEAVTASTNPYNPTTGIMYPDPITGITKPTPTPWPGGGTPTTLDYAFTTTGEFGYGLRPEYTTSRFAPLNFNGASSNASILDFFTYNPVSSSYPRSGIVNLNTRNVPVLAAILQGALKRDFNSPPPLPNPFPTVAPGEASLAAQDIVSATAAQPALNRKDIGRLTAVAAARIGNLGYTGEQLAKLPETIARALSEVTQARTWNLFIDVIAQSGRYAPGAANISEANKFIVEGEKRYWLHIALERDLVSGQVDVLGTQLEEVLE